MRGKGENEATNKGIKRNMMAGINFKQLIMKTRPKRKLPNRKQKYKEKEI